LPNSYQGEPSGAGLRIGVVVARWNGVVTERLLDGALHQLAGQGVSDDDIDVVSVPGSWEIPVAVQRLAESGRYHAIVALGAVIRGETAHFEHIATQVSSGLAQVALETGVPVTFGVLTAYNVEQALERAGGKHGNKGAEAASAAIEMANLMRSVEGEAG
jgi:6,7-dimethyl-8-ribityllumazine synthase